MVEVGVAGVACEGGAGMIGTAGCDTVGLITPCCGTSGLKLGSELRMPSLRSA